MTDASISTEVPQTAVPLGVTPTSVADPSAPQEPEYTSETLYIQNLNENVKIDGHCTCDIFLVVSQLKPCGSAQSVSAWIIQVVR